MVLEEKSQGVIHEYGFLSNLKFLLKKQWTFDKRAYIYPVIRIPSFIGVALITLNLPRMVLNAVEQGRDVSEFVYHLSFWISLLACLTFSSYYAEQAIYKEACKIWNLLFYPNKQWKIVDMDYEVFADPSGKDKILRGHWALNRNVQVNLVSFYIHFYDLIKNILGFLTFGSLLLLLNPWLLFLLVVTYGFNAKRLYKLEKWLQHTLNERIKLARKIDYLQHLTSDNRNLKELILYDLKAYLFLKLQKAMSALHDRQIEVAKKRAHQRALQNSLLALRNLLSYGYLMYKTWLGDLSVGEFVLFFGVLVSFSDWLDGITMTWQKLIVANHKCDDYRNLIDIPDFRKKTKGLPLPPMTEPIEIELENVAFHYRGSETLILEAVNLKIPKGQKLAIVGENGAGKSTLIKLIAGLLTPTAGRILVNGVDLKEFKRDDYYQMVAAVFQNICLLPASIEKNITLQRENAIDQDKLEQVSAQAGLLETIQKLPEKFATPLVPAVTLKGILLSGGEEQKLMLARALYKAVPLLILDEPTAALDPLAESQMYLRYHKLTQQRTAIYISHRLSSTRFCDKIIYLEGGRILETGQHEELLALNGKYKKMYDTQSKYYQSQKPKESCHEV